MLISTVLKITRLVMKQNFEVRSDNFDVDKICISGRYYKACNY
jgi:hypothetical protein